MAGKGNQGDLVKEQFWRDTVQRHKQSGQTIREFCDRENLRPCSLSWWRRELTKRDREVSRPEQKAKTPFLPVQVVPDSNQYQSSTAIEIVFPAGPTVRVPSGFDTQALTGVLEVLESRPC